MASSDYEFSELPGATAGGPAIFLFHGTGGDENQFLDIADAAIAELELEGEIQVASFHPQYRFAGSEPDAIEDFSNRSPYPMLHLLRESSIARAVAAFPDAERIYGRNIEALRRLGHAGWRALWSDIAAP